MATLRRDAVVTFRRLFGLISLRLSGLISLRLVGLISLRLSRADFMHRRASLPGLPSKTVVKRSIKQAAQGTAVGAFVEHLELVEVREQ